MTSTARVLRLVLGATLFGALWSGGVRPACASSGLGIAVGTVLPSGKLNLQNSTQDLGSAQVGWGFYTDLPLLPSFAITPSTTIYKFGASASTYQATDVDLAFKFIVTTPVVQPFFGLAAGVTSVGDALPVHFGGLLGLELGLAANLDLFAQGKYLTFAGTTQASTVHLDAGVLFRF